MKLIAMAVSACLIGASAALACDDHIGARARLKIGADRRGLFWNLCDRGVRTLLGIEGVATCDTGFIRIRLYDGEGDGQRFLGTAEGFIDGHVFSALATNLDTPKNLSIKYSIDPNW